MSTTLAAITATAATIAANTQKARSVAATLGIDPDVAGVVR